MASVSLFSRTLSKPIEIESWVVSISKFSTLTDIPYLRVLITHLTLLPVKVLTPEITQGISIPIVLSLSGYILLRDNWGNSRTM